MQVNFVLVDVSQMERPSYLYLHKCSYLVMFSVVYSFPLGWDFKMSFTCSRTVSISGPSVCILMKGAD